MSRSCREREARQRELIRRLEASTSQCQDTDKAATEAAGEARKQLTCVSLLSKQLADTQQALRYSKPQQSTCIAACQGLKSRQSTINRAADFTSNTFLEGWLVMACLCFAQQCVQLPPVIVKHPHAETRLQGRGLMR